MQRQKKVIGKIDKDKLQQMYSLAWQVKEGNYSEQEWGGCDAGGYETYCYRWNDDEKTYKTILLGMTGGTVYRNLDKNAIELDFWLRCDVLKKRDRESLQSEYDYKE